MIASIPIELSFSKHFHKHYLSKSRLALTKVVLSQIRDEVTYTWKVRGLCLRSQNYEVAEPGPEFRPC